MSKNKILILTSDYRIIGGVSVFYNLLELHKYRELDYFYVNSLVKQSPFKKVIRLFINYLHYSYLLINKRYTAIHINPSFDRNSFFRDAIFILIAKVMRKKIIILFHGWEDKFENSVRNNKFNYLLFKKAYNHCHYYMVLGQIFKDKLINLGIKKDCKFDIITTVADSSHIKELDLDKKFAAYDKQINILFLSRIERAKGIYLALDTIKKINELNPTTDIQFIVAGDGLDLKKAKDYVIVNEISSVNFTGFVLDEARKNLLIDSHIMLFPTYYGEGLPLVILEGMLYAMPIISRINAAIPDVVEHGVNGFLDESLEPEIFAQYVHQLINDKSLYMNISKTNHKKASEQYTTEKVRERILSIYDDL
jgi:glycosyltransferase involved in cell wall biosynthesis